MEEFLSSHGESMMALNCELIKIHLVYLHLGFLLIDEISFISIILG